jgi:exosortase A
VKPEAEFPLPTAVGSPSAARRAGIAVAIAVAAILGVYFGTAESIVAIWHRAETFAHGFVVIPIALWLVWRNRASLANVPVKPFWPGIAGVALFGAAWLVGSTSGVLGIEQFALLFMIQAGIVTIVGLRFARAIAFPLFFLVFAVPFGEVFVPKLIDWTADFTVLALKASGVPVFREGNHFIIPSGAWSVVEACSGIRYLIASLMVGTLYAHLTYRSRWRQAAFVLASILVPIVANWLRAYMIVMLGHLSSNRIAVGVDHLIYGWIFFGVVMVLMFWIGSFWREDHKPAPAGRAASSAALTGVAAQPVSAGRLAMAMLVVIIAAGMWRPIGAAVESGLNATAPTLAPLSDASGWTPLAKPPADFKPHYLGARAELEQGFAKGAERVGLYVGYFRAQKQGEEMVGSANVLVTPKETKWKQLASGRDQVAWNGTETTAATATLGNDLNEMAVLRLYWVNGRLTSSDYAAKALLALSKLTGQGDDSAVIVVYTPKVLKGDETSATLRAFVQQNSPAIERMLSATKDR